MAKERKQQTHSAKLKARVAVDALKESNTLAEVACRGGDCRLGHFGLVD